MFNRTADKHQDDKIIPGQLCLLVHWYILVFIHLYMLLLLDESDGEAESTIKLSEYVTCKPHTNYVNQLQTLKTRCCNRKKQRPLGFVTDLHAIRLSEFISQVVSTRKHGRSFCKHY